MDSLTYIILEWNCLYFKSWKQKMILGIRVFEQTCMGKEVWSNNHVDAQAKYDVKNQEVVMLIKFYHEFKMVMMCLSRGAVTKKNMKSQIKVNMLFLIKMEEFNFLQDHLLNIHDIIDQLKRKWKKKKW